eukprot:TRINITY_DN8218_c0_g1_i1.p1 TRINITY_DN8218_c0_g1~~TRINITY_DN8218_c0_g1_i1.p1  ORF type:complete len:279 (-),score=43.89 TRINITY_DN8218_c0_g1_i1:81-917(-)
MEASTVPPELWLRICFHLDLTSIGRFGSSCVEFREIAWEPKLWNKLCKIHGWDRSSSSQTWMTLFREKFFQLKEIQATMEAALIFFDSTMQDPVWNQKLKFVHCYSQSSAIKLSHVLEIPIQIVKEFIYNPELRKEWDLSCTSGRIKDVIVNYKNISKWNQQNGKSTLFIDLRRFYWSESCLEFHCGCFQLENGDIYFIENETDDGETDMGIKGTGWLLQKVDDRRTKVHYLIQIMDPSDEYLRELAVDRNKCFFGMQALYLDQSTNQTFFSENLMSP